ncbi:E3 ubiquitin-protein ligase RGLG2-like protein isoform X1 [Cinnamomum micranthum f. kanehirae]|uniref:E3 ubiquitin-protein ligase RGLG2-like protein isoform X1 n=1 Tax=Cinnamomum micranthum f. kanehirae TaxID=337451 RepID=A0A3S3ND65_9MAGN|nr:E3 ubiquitin-protein ligase RGLG2-like protein isoform X1 [Cinnamomum micranthum f. kanehirae]
MVSPPSLKALSVFKVLAQFLLIMGILRQRAQLRLPVCPICLTNPKDMAFGCGHQTCCDCGECLTSCPICRSDIHTRIKLY